MFSRDLYCWSTGELWGVVVVGTMYCTREGSGNTSFDRCTSALSYTWEKTAKQAMLRARREIATKLSSGFTETARSLTRRSFQFTEGNHRKFWIIELDVCSHVVRYGRIPKDDRCGYGLSGGQRLEKRFANPEKARASYEKLIGKKLTDGYVECEKRVERKRRSKSDV